MDEYESAVQFLLRRLREHGVSHVFGVPGGPLLPLYEGLAAQDTIVSVLAKHEEGAAFMAEGFAQVSGRLGVICATTGPGATNALTAIASASVDYAPVLLISGQVATHVMGKGSLQDSSGGNWSLDLVGLYKSVTKLSAAVSSAAQLPGHLDHAVRTALSGLPGAVHLNIPADVLTEQITPDGHAHSPRRTVRPVGPHRRALAELAAAVRRCRRPVFLVGQGAKASGAGPCLVDLAEWLGAPVATTLKGKGAFPEDHPLSLGVYGLGGDLATREALCSEQIDLLIVVGSSLGELATFGWDQELVANRGVCQIDLDPVRIGRNFAVDLAVVGDARTTLEALLEALGDAHWDIPLPPSRSRSRSRTTARELQNGHRTLQASALVSRMSETLPPDTILFVDNGNCLSWVGQFYAARAAGQIHLSLNVGSMGYAAAAVIGGKLAAPGRPAVAVLGDAAFAMHGMEVHTAAELGLPAIWVVLNNSGHAMVGNVQQMLYGRTPIARYREPLNIAAIAAGLGATSTRVESLEELDAALKNALTATGPYVIDARVDFEEVPWALASRVHTLRGFFHTGQDTHERQEQL